MEKWKKCSQDDRRSYVKIYEPTLSGANAKLRTMRRTEILWEKVEEAVPLLQEKRSSKMVRNLRSQH